MGIIGNNDKTLLGVNFVVTPCIGLLILVECWSILEMLSSRDCGKFATKGRRILALGRIAAAHGPFSRIHQVTHHLEQSAGQPDICPVSVILPSAFNTFLF